MTPQQKRVRAWIYGVLVLAVVASATSLPGKVSAKPPRVPASTETTETYGEETLSHIGSGKNVELKGTTVEGPVMSGRSIQGSECMSGDMTAAENIRVTHCKTGRLMASQDVFIFNSDVEGSVTTAGRLELEGAKITGDVTVRGEAVIRNAVIEGTLTARADKLAIRGSRIGAIRVSSATAKTGGGSQMIISGGTVTTAGDGKPLIKVQGNGRAVYNGYILEGVPAGTRVVTPEGYVYINGRRMGVEGPSTYALFKARVGDAPAVEGPNWSDGELSADEAPTQPLVDVPQPPLEVIELYNNSEVEGDIQFGSGRGLVRLKNGSTVKGQVIGGILDTEGTP